MGTHGVEGHTKGRDIVQQGRYAGAKHHEQAAHQKEGVEADDIIGTLDKMADRLEMSTRSYADLKSGNNGCSGLTLALFLIYVCPDASEFLRKLRDALEASGNKAA